MQYPEKLVFCGRVVKVSGFFINKEGIWYPNQLDVLGSDHQFFQAHPSFKGKPGVSPELTEIHVKGKVLE